MTLEITRPETEARIRRYLQSGQFHDLDELLSKALDALPEPAAAVARHGTLHEFFMNSPFRGANLREIPMTALPSVRVTGISCEPTMLMECQRKQRSR
jgi:hypothetical protein